MKQIDRMSRLSGELEKLFRLLNDEFFGGVLPTPIITIIPSTRSYAHYTTWDAWQSKGEPKREINISSTYLSRPLEYTVSSLIHECVHFYCDVILNVQDTSNKGIYHNRIFKREAEAHGLIVSRSEKYGWSHTEPSERIIDFILNHEELREIELFRDSSDMVAVGIGKHAGNSSGKSISGKSGSRKYMCPCCGNSVRATKAVNIACLDCNERMIEA